MLIKLLRLQYLVTSLITRNYLSNNKNFYSSCFIHHKQNFATTKTNKTIFPSIFRILLSRNILGPFWISHTPCRSCHSLVIVIILPTRRMCLEGKYCFVPGEYLKCSWSYEKDVGGFCLSPPKDETPFEEINVVGKKNISPNWGVFRGWFVRGFEVSSI